MDITEAREILAGATTRKKSFATILAKALVGERITTQERECLEQATDKLVCQISDRLVKERE